MGPNITTIHRRPAALGGARGRHAGLLAALLAASLSPADAAALETMPGKVAEAKPDGCGNHCHSACVPGYAVQCDSAPREVVDYLNRLLTQAEIPAFPACEFVDPYAPMPNVVAEVVAELRAFLVAGRRAYETAAPPEAEPAEVTLESIAGQLTAMGETITNLAGRVDALEVTGTGDVVVNDNLGGDGSGDGGTGDGGASLQSIADQLTTLTDALLALTGRVDALEAANGGGGGGGS